MNYENYFIDVEGDQLINNQLDKELMNYLLRTTTDGDGHSVCDKTPHEARIVSTMRATKVAPTLRMAVTTAQ